jgi:hypothetical protein
VWWVSARIREERESCCDELAAEVVGSRKEYAAALATMETLRGGGGGDGPPTVVASNPAMSAAGGPLLRRIRRLAVAEPFGNPGSSSRFGPAAVLAPLVTAGVLFLFAAQLVATSVRVEPPHGLHDVQALGAAVYRALDVFDAPPPVEYVPNADHDTLLTRYRAALASYSSDDKTFDPDAVDNLVPVVLTNQHYDALAAEQLAMTDVDNRLGSESRPGWQYGNLALRTNLLRFMLRHAATVKRDDPEAARRYARAAILLAAQDSAVNATYPLGQVMSPRYSAKELAQLSDRESARLNRAIEDHRVIMRVASMEMARAMDALRALADQRAGRAELTDDEVRRLREQLAEAVERMIRVSGGRPDIEWTTAYVCWHARSVLGEEGPKLQERLLKGVGEAETPHLRRWIKDALSEPAQPLPHVPTRPGWMLRLEAPPPPP